MEYEVPSVALAARILKLLSRYKHKHCSLKEIAERLNTNKTTCLRVLRTLEREDFLKYDSETKKYSLGPYLIPLGKRASALNDFVSAAMAELAVVAEATGFTTVLVERLQDDRLIYIASEQPAHDHPTISVSIGQQFPLGGAAFGRCFLAFDDESEWQRFVERGMIRYTSHTEVEPEEFLASLREARRRGYTVSHGTLMQGITSIAAPIFGKSGRVELVMSSLAMTSQLDEETVAKTVRVLLEHTRRLSRQHGGMAVADEYA
ncbi:MAG: IclR family transcriptional regulator [Alicyclobacillus herbarius]|uniref:IclR family transcriptional regulator n=1 Tax=Alicyclobacillus herbarius TaxID=122960 RepID=UPI000412AC21|nr:IclR family transcriptional regulator [Alicyclobacillus herbarius]MCL6632483.1 IclR family transcriptional regulator [Alicyclobacillus herbarius]